MDFYFDKTLMLLLFGIIYGLALCYLMTFKIMFFKKHHKYPPNGLLDRILFISSIVFFSLIWLF